MSILVDNKRIRKVQFSIFNETRISHLIIFLDTFNARVIDNWDTSLPMLAPSGRLILKQVKIRISAIIGISSSYKPIRKAFRRSILETGPSESGGLEYRGIWNAAAVKRKH